MTGPAPAFDRSRYLQARCTRRELGIACEALRKLERSLEARQRRRRRRFLALTAGLAAVAVAAAAVDDLAPAGALMLVALAYAFAATGLVSLFGPQTTLLQRAPRALRIFLLVNPGIFLYGWAGKAWAEQGPRIDPLARPLPAALGLLASTAVVLWVRQLAAWDRLARVEPQLLEVDYLASLAGALLRDLPEGERAAITFNPYRAEWSRVKLSLPPRPGYTLDAGADVLLELKLPLSGGGAFRLSVVEFSTHKVKNRKGKYKGTKRHLVYRLALDAPPDRAPAPAAPARDLSPALADHLRAAARGWTPARECAGGLFPGLGDFTADPARLKLSARAGGGRIAATVVLKSAGLDRELQPGHLLAPSLVLAAAQWMGRAEAEAGP